MTPSLIFLVQALVVISVPLAFLRFSGLKGLVPLVVVQIVVGIALGPSLFGRLAPELHQLLFNAAASAPLTGIASVAILVFGLITGLHVDTAALRENRRAISVVAASNIAVPTALGAIAGFWVLARYPEELAPGTSPVEFAAAFGISIGMTALPVLGALLHELDLLGRRIGHLALAIAAVNDMVLWVALGVLLTVAAGQAAGGPGLLATLLFVPLYLAVMVRFVRPWLGGMVAARMRNGEVHERALALVGTVTIASSLATEAMGLHYILGAFITGVVMPDELRKPLLDRLQVLTMVLLMPFFFTLTGLRTVIDPHSSAFLGVFVLATVVAVAGVIGGTALAARFVGASWPFALGLGALLQTKGMMELIVLTILLDAGIISPNVFAALILMAVVSTALAMPLARLLLGRTAMGGVTPDRSPSEIGTFEA